MNDRTDAAAALAAIQDSRQRLAARAGSSISRHLAFAGVMAAIVASPGAPQGMRTALVVLSVVAITSIVAWDRRRTGMFINGFHPGPTRWLTVAVTAMMVAGYLLSDRVGDRHGWTWYPVAIGLVAGMIGFAASILWERIYLRDLERDA